ncbi:MATE family efflux transporter [Akkermansia sp. N21116]|nr:MATE family efflux transporter [Akkermansia sp. N21116]WPX40684.1 MATE family efflux transporter [Akkermansia sp. N21116]
MTAYSPATMGRSGNIRALEEEPIFRLLIKYSLPAIAGMVVMSLYNIVDSIFIGHGIGDLALSGMAITFPIMNLSIAISTLIGLGGATVSSLKLGAQKTRSAQKVLGNVIMLGFITGLLIGPVTVFFLKDILLLFGASEQTLPYAYDFMRIILLGMPITHSFFNLNNVMRSTGYPQKAMYSMMLTVVINFILAPLFIFVFQWGMTGAASATLISQIVGLAWVILHFCKPNSTVHFRAGIYRLRWSIILPILSIGMAPFLVNACACAVAIIVNRSLLSTGGDLAVGAFGIINRVLILFIMLTIGITQGMQPIVGYNYGARHFDRVRQALKYAILGGTVFTTAGFLVSQIFPHLIASLFNAKGELAIFTITGLHLTTLAYPLVGGQIVIGNFFQAIGKARISVFLSTTRQLIFLIPALFILPKYWGYSGVWYSFPTADVLSVLVTIAVFIRFSQRNKWIRKLPQS